MTIHRVGRFRGPLTSSLADAEVGLVDVAARHHLSEQLAAQLTHLAHARMTISACTYMHEKATVASKPGMDVPPPGASVATRRCPPRRL